MGIGQGAIHVQDALGRKLVLSGPARRVVSLVPSISEAADALMEKGCGVLVGCTKFCVHPKALRERCTVVGGTKAFHAARIADLEPDLILANREENEREAIEALAEHWPVYVSAVADLDGNQRLLEDLGRLLGAEAQAAALIRDTDAAFAAWRRKRPKMLRAPRAVYAIWREPWMFAGGGTFIDAMLRQGGWVNALADRKRYPSLDLDALAALEPDVVLLSSEPFPFAEQHRLELLKVLNNKGLVTRVVFADGEAFSWYGYRPLEAPKAFEAVHRDLGTY